MRLVDAIYLRKSKMDIELEKIGEEETLARHKKILTELAKRKDLNVGKIYQEVVSGETIQDRPVMQELLKDIYSNKYRSVIVMEIERLARGNTKDQGEVAEAFKFSNTFIVTPAKTYDPNNEFDEEYLEFGLFMSRREYKTIQRRMLAGKVQAIKDGNYLGSLPPFGYDIQKNSKRDRTLKFNEQTKYIKMIYDWFIDDRVNPSEIARRLTSLGVVTRTGNSEWNRATVKDILTNDLYTGKVRWFRRKTTREFDNVTMKKVKHRNAHEDYLLVDGKHEAIISEERFAQAQAFFKKSVPAKSTSMVNPFAGLVRCKKCGKMMTYHRIPHRPNVKPKIIHRAGYTCNTKPIAYVEFLTIVLDEIKRQISDFEIKIEEYRLEDKQAEYDDIRHTLDGNLRKEKTKLNRLFDNFEEGLYEKEEFRERKDIINSKIKNLKHQIESLVMPTNTEYKEKVNSFHEIISTIGDPNIPVIHQNMLLKSIIKEINYVNDTDIEIDIHFL